MFKRLRLSSKFNVTKSSLLSLSVAVLIFFLFFWRLGTLTPGMSAQEIAAGKTSVSIGTLADNPLFGPHKITQFVSQKLFGHGAADLRITSALFGVFFVLGFYYLLRNWFGRLVAIFGTLFLAATPWFVLLSRSATPAILYMAPLAVLACYYWAVRSEKPIALYVFFILTSLSLYVPGMAWLALTGLFFCRKQLGDLIAKIKIMHRSLAILAATVLTIPLMLAAIKTPGLINDLLLLPDNWPPVLTSLKIITWNVLALFGQTPTHTDFIIGRLPMLNYAQVALAVFGGFALFKHVPRKSFILLTMAVFGVLAASINQNLAILTLVLPALALAIAAGLRYLYMEWNSVFPKNPIPKYWAVLLIALLCLLHIGYGIRYSLIAWPNTTEARSTFVLK